MFASIANQIRRLPWWGQMLAWPFYGVAYVVASVGGWALTELGSQAKSGTKKVFAPFLPYLAGAVLLVLLFAVVGPGGMEIIITQAVAPLIVIVIICYGLYVMAKAPFTSAKKKKKKNK
ncbi:hypothetical protein EXS62_01680 [Candidatus Kaiserbacteria bacterium]|nr:hypothetical protein [Candidatus Kaiserbacteria bacterium]